jgi:hypothetical protein
MVSAWEDASAIRLKVDRWFQTIAHEKGGGFVVVAGHQLSFDAHADESEELELTSGEKIRDLRASMSISRGLRENPLQRGIGVLAYYPPTPAGVDTAPMPSAIGGWFCLPEASYDEVWVQVREKRFAACTINLEIAPVQFPAMEVVWNTQGNKAISILGVAVMFER